MAPANVLIQSTTIDLLQAIVSRGEIDLPSLQNVQSAVIGKLYFSINRQRLALQNKLLHLLHSVITAMTGSQNLTTPRPNKGATTDSLADPSALDRPDDSHALSIHPLLLQTLIDGINVPQILLYYNIGWISFLWLSLNFITRSNLWSPHWVTVSAKTCAFAWMSSTGPSEKGMITMISGRPQRTSSSSRYSMP